MNSLMASMPPRIKNICGNEGNCLDWQTFEPGPTIKSNNKIDSSHQSVEVPSILSTNGFRNEIEGTKSRGRIYTRWQSAPLGLSFMQLLSLRSTEAVGIGKNAISDSHPRLNGTPFILNQEQHIHNTHLATNSYKAI
jgi:hypothetical protein